MGTPALFYSWGQLRHKEVKWLTPGHTASKWWSQNFFFFFCFFRAAPAAYGSSQARGPQLQQHQIQPPPLLMATLDPLTHRARPGIEPASSWVLAGLITAEPRQELLESEFKSGDQNLSLQWLGDTAYSMMLGFSCPPCPSSLLPHSFHSIILKHCSRVFGSIKMAKEQKDSKIKN